MKTESESLRTARGVLAELSRLRATAGRAETLAGLKALAQIQAAHEQEGPHRVAMEAIATLRAAYAQPEPVADRLWAEVVNRLIDWVRAVETD